jgi:hypothetical protein
MGLRMLTTLGISAHRMTFLRPRGGVGPQEGDGGPGRRLGAAPIAVGSTPWHPWPPPLTRYEPLRAPLGQDYLAAKTCVQYFVPLEFLATPTPMRV